jgi:Ca-activated chloride channel homolog
MEENQMASPDNQIPLLDLPEGAERRLGSLLASRGMERISLPLASVDIGARVVDRIAQVTVKQVFANNLSENLEAVYIFPLAPASAIFSFNMKVGDRVVKGVVQERAEARQAYQQALADGKRAALLEQERDDVFTVQVGNLPPGEEVTIEISYSERLPFFENGESELRLPLVVAPRYIPGTPLARESVGDGNCVDTDLVADASRITPPRLARGVDPQTALKLKVEILPEASASLFDLFCTQHATRTDLEQGGINVTLARVDEKLNRDFVLRWRSTSDRVKTSLITYKDASGETYGLLSIMPPRREGYLGAPRDIVFVLDRSGSMQGIKMTSAVRACSILLNTLGPNDRFAIAAFDNVVEWMPAQDRAGFVSADSAGIENGEKYLHTITARGGTEMDRALRSSFDALNNRSHRDGRLPSLVILTDGEVGNESQILQRIQKEIGDARLFAVGIDTAVNSGLLKRLASLGGGTAAFVEPGIQLEEALTSIAREIGAPLVTDLQVENLDLSLDRASFSPSRVPDVFAGRASVCFFKLSGKGRLTVRGKLAGGKVFEEKVKAQNVEMPSIAQLWAKAHIVDLEDQYRVNQGNRNKLKREIIDLAVKHSLLTKFTAFVVVDEAEIVNQSGESRRVVQPVEMPESWEMEGQQAYGGAWGGADDLLATSTRLRSLAKASYGSASPAAPPAPSYQPSPSPRPSAPMAGRSAPPARGNSKDRAKEVDGLFMKLEAPDSASKQQAPAPDSWGAPPAQDSGWADAGAGTAPSGSFLADSRAAAGKKLDHCREFASSQPAAAPEPVATPTGGIGSIFDRLVKFVYSKQDNKDNLRNEIIKFKNKLIDFFREFETAYEMIGKGDLPDAGKLESVRVTLVQTLAPTKLGMELPYLQRFLRATAVELVGSLKQSSITIAELETFWKERQELFEETKTEFTNLLSGREASFWEESI